MPTIKGAFDVKMRTNAVEDGVGRFTFDKHFHGPLAGTSVVHMMATGDPKVSAGYVAIELFSGGLEGKMGAFVMRHHGTSHKGKQSLRIDVTPGSGTGELHGLTGELTIDIVEGKHLYTLTYDFET